jgi:hypothetical protein
MSLYSNMLFGAHSDDNHEVMKWITIEESFPLDSKSCVGFLNRLNGDLAHKYVLLETNLLFSILPSFLFSLFENQQLDLKDLHLHSYRSYRSNG